MKRILNNSVLVCLIAVLIHCQESFGQWRPGIVDSMAGRYGAFMEGYRKQFIHLRTTSHTGPLVLVDGRLEEGDLELAARITGRYGKGRTAEQVTVEATFPEGRVQILEVAPMPPNEIQQEWMV